MWAFGECDQLCQCGKWQLAGMTQGHFNGCHTNQCHTQRFITSRAVDFVKLTQLKRVAGIWMCVVHTVTGERLCRR